jgi:hypothetical protein
MPSSQHRFPPFGRVPPRSELATSDWKAYCWLVLAVHEDDSSRVTRCGHMWCPMGNHPASAWRTGGEPGQTPQVVLLAVFSHPLSRYFPLLYLPPVLCLWCADRMSSTPRTLLVLSLHRQTLHGEDKRRQDSTPHHPPGKNCWKWMPSPRSRTLLASIPLAGPAFPLRASRLLTSRCFHPRRHERGRPRKMTVAPSVGTRKRACCSEGSLRACTLLSFWLSTLLLNSKHEATDRLMRDTRGFCHRWERFLLLHHTLHHARPVGSGKSGRWAFWPWRPFATHRRRTGVSCFILNQQVLHLEIQFSRRGKQEGKNW